MPNAVALRGAEWSLEFQNSFNIEDCWLNWNSFNRLRVRNDPRLGTTCLWWIRFPFEHTKSQDPSLCREFLFVLYVFIFNRGVFPRAHWTSQKRRQGKMDNASAPRVSGSVNILWTLYSLMVPFGLVLLAIRDMQAQFNIPAQRIGQSLLMIGCHQTWNVSASFMPLLSRCWRQRNANEDIWTLIEVTCTENHYKFTGI